MRFKYLLLIFIVLLVSVLRIRSSLRFSRNYLPGQRVRITERLTEQPYQSRSGQYFRLGGVRILTPDYPTYSLGSMLEVEGRLKRNGSRPSVGLPGLSAADFWLIYPDISVVEVNALPSDVPASLWEEFLLSVYRLRSSIVDFYGSVLPEPHASLLAGIVLGERATMPQTFYTRLRETGSLHIIAASGMNVTIVAGIIINLLVLVISRRLAVIVGILGVAFYAVLAGLSPPVVRAALMGTVAYVAIAFGRQRDGLIALIAVAAMMLLLKPDYLVDVGWQLSVAATLGIVLLREPIDRYILIFFDRLRWRWEMGRGKLESRGEKWEARESYFTHQYLVSHLSFLTSLSEELAVTLSAQALTLPLILFYFEIFSWTSPLVNILLAPVVPVLMIWGGVVALVGLVWPWLGQVVAWGAWVFLEYFVRVVEVFGRWFGAVEVGQVPVTLVVGYYLVIAWFIWRIKGKIKDIKENEGDWRIKGKSDSPSTRKPQVSA